MKNKFIFLLIISFCFLQNADGQKSNKKLTIWGYVMDSNKNPVIGALILVDNKNTGEVTDDNGYYKLKVKSDAKTLTAFTFNGASAKAPIEGRTSISFVLDKGSPIQKKVQNEKATDEILNVGYSNVNKDQLSQPVDKIEVTETDYSSYKNIYDLISSKVPGVDVRDGKIVIRGTSTLMGGTDPLFIVDGNIMGSIDFIQPNSVKSIEVLKGSSAAIYGLRGSNGVILINTIKGGDK
jgi:TonB-dependent starch-binding outer membrane protein SusC